MIGIDSGNLMRLFFSRHGESEANVLRVMSNRQVPHHLTELGRAQAFQLAETLIETPICHIYASPICRARETAEIVSNRLKKPMSIADGLREFDCGVMEGRGDEEAWAEHLAVQKRWYELGAKSARIEGGESLAEVEARFWRSLQEVEARHEGRDEAVLLVTHGALLYSMMPLVFPNVVRERIYDYGLNNANVIEGSSDRGVRKCVRWNDRLFI